MQLDMRSRQLHLLNRIPLLSMNGSFVGFQSSFFP